MCDEVCSCCEKDICKCTNNVNEYLDLIEKYMSSICLNEENYKIEKMESSLVAYRITLDPKYWFFVEQKHIDKLGNKLKEFHISTNINNNRTIGEIYFNH